MGKDKKSKRFDITLNRLSESTPFSIREAYKSIRTNLLFSLAPLGKKTVVISSALSNEGKSTTCGNLAITFAQTSAKVLLIDGDLRKPTMHKFFEVENTKGLSNLLVGFDSVADSVKRNIVKNLDIITAGALPPNPSELLGSRNMQIFIQKMEEYYDYILIDSPPINVVTDAVVLSQHAAGILMVARSMETTIEELNNALESICTANGNVLGIVVSDVRKESKSKYYSSYYNSYSKNRYSPYYGGEYGQPYRERKPDAVAPDEIADP